MIIGITGGSGSGKTTALSVLKEMGAEIIDCDAVYHELLQTSTDLSDELYRRFPDAFENGILNRKALGNIVFSDSERLNELSLITDEFVRAEVLRLTKCNELSAIDAIRLIESGLSQDCDCTVCILAPIEDRIKRIMARDGISLEYAKMRIKAQMPDEFYTSSCDYTLINDGDLSIFRQKCEKLFKDIIGGRQ